ncbi:hypothetical protein P171DRAFT_469679 [Karstenula rhodostoma CBS 690.94]|uniref:F-box domain-containing protein n=1 Tax=Karstenula rhodostoma CBS 690.94 TaxID=1392251 RepID=A0A9P4PUY4_9PLEO|nr:hypothetical protein P171DRAFT_469679 [Karstenula rhodostoma CBS 690.94]
MERLAPELHAMILECILKDHPRNSRNPIATLAPYAVISRRWQDSVERYTFRKINRLKTTELHNFKELFTGTNIRRRELLKQLSIYFILPDPPNMDGCCEVEAIPDRDADSKTFTKAVVQLFDILSDLEHRSQRKSMLSLVLDEAYRTSPPKLHLGGVYMNRCKKHRTAQIQEAKTNSGKFELLPETSLAILDDISRFECTGHYLLAELRPTWIPIMMSHLPRLDKLVVQERDLYTFGRTRRLSDRRELQRSLCFPPTEHLTEIVLDVEHTPLCNEDISVQRLIGQSNWREETWSIVLRHLARFPVLKKLHLLGELVICPELFTNITEYKGTPFPSLQELVLEFAIETADGRWFYQRDEEAFTQAKSDPELQHFSEDIEDSDEDPTDAEFDSDTDGYVRLFEDSPVRTSVVGHDRFRTLPDKDTFGVLLETASRAVLRFPQLRKFILNLADRYTLNRDGVYYPYIPRHFELWWLKSGEPRSPLKAEPKYLGYPKVACDAKYIHQNRLYWRTGSWIPWEEAQSAWAKAAGPDVKIVFLEEKFWSGGRSRLASSVYSGEF